MRNTYVKIYREYEGRFVARHAHIANYRGDVPRNWDRGPVQLCLNPFDMCITDAGPDDTIEMFTVMPVLYRWPNGCERHILTVSEKFKVPDNELWANVEYGEADSGPDASPFDCTVAPYGG